MNALVSDYRVGIEAIDCVTCFGNAQITVDRLNAHAVGLEPSSVLGTEGGDCVPLALRQPMTETVPPRWWSDVGALAAPLQCGKWGKLRTPIFITSSNFGIENLYGYHRDQDASRLPWSTAHALIDNMAKAWNWGKNITIISHACVSAQLGLIQASRALETKTADEVLVFSFDFLSPFVVGGFHALKILNEAMPAPYADREMGAIGLGDGAAYAILSNAKTNFSIQAQHAYNEMYHFTANEPEGSGFKALLEPVRSYVGDRKVWFKGHGTGTLEAGQLEAQACTEYLPGAPIVSWKGSIGHTLGSCALVELAMAMAAIEKGQIPGTVGTTGKCFSDSVATDSFALSDYQAAVLASNAFGGAHAGMVLSYD